MRTRGGEVERHLPFERGVNFRDVGGYETHDGARVKWRKLFRCGALNKLTDADLTRLEDLGLAAVCDFRGPSERAEAPSRLPRSLHPHVRHLEIEPGGAFTAERDILDLVTGKRSAAELSARIAEIYKDIAIGFAPAYAALFRHLQEAAGAPVLFHCAGGKDRTGIGAALILTTLGVPEETIHADYLLSRESVPLRLWLESLLNHAAAHHPLPRPRAELLEEIMGVWGVSPNWLDAAFTAMRAQAGSVDAYLCDTLGVTASARDNLRRWYLAD